MSTDAFGRRNARPREPYDVNPAAAQILEFDTGELMRSNRPRISSVLSRCAALRCPACGHAAIFDAPFRVRHHCSSCAALFEREEGFFVGAIMINVVTTELVGLAGYFVCLLAIGYSERLILTTVLPLSLIFPAVFYHHSWSLWLSLDYVVEGLPEYDG